MQERQPQIAAPIFTFLDVMRFSPAGPPDARDLHLNMEVRALTALAPAFLVEDPFGDVVIGVDQDGARARVVLDVLERQLVIVEQQVPDDLIAVGELDQGIVVADLPVAALRFERRMPDRLALLFE